MADKKEKGAKHLTSLTLDIEGIRQALEEAQTLIEQKSIELGKEWRENFAKQVNASSKSPSVGITPEEAKKTSAALSDLRGEYGRLIQVIKDVDAAGKEAKRTSVFEDPDGKQKKIVQATVKGEEQITISLRDNIKKREEARKKEYASSLQNLENLIRKQKEFTATLEKQKKSKGNLELTKQSKELTERLIAERDALVNTGKAADGTKENIANLANESKNLGTAFKTTGDQGTSILKQITEKAKELTLYYAAIKAKEAFQDVVKTLKETEDAVVELQRVLKQDVSKEGISKQLYDIAFEYGRGFDDVQEVAVKFAQTGANWEDTVKLTKSAMLALNTAELDVQQSTEGLIAIMSQWNVEAKDMEVVIDKINTTADSFPVTSEKIIAALQRASSSARQAKLSFEETVGAITAMSEATGRSGEVIGTALNSLLIYTSKPKALETFYEVGNETVRNTVDAYRTGAVSILEVWKALSKQLEALGGAQKEAIAKQLYEGVGGEDFAQHLEEHAAVITDDIKKIYGTAGTFRQNYLVALLSDIDTIDKVTENMTDAVGYSTEENKKYIATLSAKIEQLTALWKGLFVEMNEGNFGFMGALKLFTDLGIATGKLVKATGGLNAWLTLLVGTLLKLNATKVTNKVVIPLSNGFKNLTTRVHSATTSFKSAMKAGEGLSHSMKRAKLALMGTDAAAKGLVSTFATFQVAVGALMAVEGIISSAVESRREASREQRDASIEEKKAILEQADSTRDLYSEWERLSNASTRTSDEQKKFEKTTWDLAKAMRIATTDGNGTVKTVDDLAEAIRNAKDAASGLTEGEWVEYLDDLQDKLEHAGMKSGLFGIEYSDVKLQGKKILDVAGDTRDELINILGDFRQRTESGDFFFGPFSGKQNEEFYEAAQSARDYLETIKETRGWTDAEKEAFKALGKEMSKVEEEYKANLEGKIKYQIAQEKITESTLGSTQALEDYKQHLLDLGIGSESTKAILDEIVDRTFPELSQQLVDATHAFEITEDEVKYLSETMKDLNSAIDTSQSAFDGVHDAIDEFNQNGYISVDTIQKLTTGGYEFIKSLDLTSESIKMADGATESLVNTQKENVLQSIKLAAAMDLLQYSEDFFKGTTEETTTETENLTNRLYGTKKAFADLTIEAFNAAEGANAYAREAAKAFGSEIPESVDRAKFERGLADRYSTWQKYLDFAKNDIQSVNQFSNKAAKSQASAAKSATQAKKKELDAQKKAINDYYKSEKDRLDEQKKAVKERYQAEIDALKEVQEENKRKDKQEEYLKRKREAETDIAKAKSRSGVDYREQEAEAQQKLLEIEEKRQKELRDQSVEDRIKELEKLRDAEIAGIDAQVKALEKMKEKQLNGIESQVKAIEAIPPAAEKAYTKVGNSATDTSKKTSSTIADHASKLNEGIKTDANKMIDQLAEAIVTSQTNANNKLVSNAKITAAKMAMAYKNNFITPLSNDMDRLTLGFAVSQSAPFQRATIPQVSIPRIEPVAPGTQNSSYYNYNTNSTNLINVTGENSARGLRNSPLWTKP